MQNTIKRGNDPGLRGPEMTGTYFTLYVDVCQTHLHGSCANVTLAYCKSWVLLTLLAAVDAMQLAICRQRFSLPNPDPDSPAAMACKTLTGDHSSQIMPARGDLHSRTEPAHLSLVFSITCVLMGLIVHCYLRLLLLLLLLQETRSPTLALRLPL